MTQPYDHGPSGFDWNAHYRANIEASERQLMLTKPHTTQLEEFLVSVRDDLFAQPRPIKFVPDDSAADEAEELLWETLDAWYRSHKLYDDGMVFSTGQLCNNAQHAIRWRARPNHPLAHQGYDVWRGVSDRLEHVLTTAVGMGWIISTGYNLYTFA